MKKILLISSILISNIINAEYLFTIEPKNYKGYIQQDIQYTNGWSNSGINKQTGKNYDQNGFLQNGQHKDTGTEYDPEGFDIEGYGIEECQSYNWSYQHVRYVDYNVGSPSEENSYYTFMWSKNEFKGHFQDETYSEGKIEQIIDNHLYYPKGDFVYLQYGRGNSPNLYTDTKWIICRKEIRQ